MSEAHNLGIEGEELAVKFLKDAGYKILFRNWTFGKLEVDIIAENNEFLVFAEVKTRTEDFLAPIQTLISREKQRSIIFAAEGYVKRYRVDKESRFDVIMVTKKKDGFEIEHIADAFYPSIK
ncbi:MAG TPA: YraN family protein [Bacteroidales bacterium]|nr:YraN family protein [Bacteroidales bacterium]